MGVFGEEHGAGGGGLLTPGVGVDEVVALARGDLVDPGLVGLDDLVGRRVAREVDHGPERVTAV
ncbi:hypothetical protein JOD54_004709 [Actinokineospora baliensis]|uniref:hypothetical protein n=1 Tax=Actinokineospora baliensis TaxID=547056 RepID=UPI00195DC772|nr:hypothetical protein [Actinokineospora baliensis]MBM7774505.1 hypothetical protein [Actinokineospora baliensis]